MPFLPPQEPPPVLLDLDFARPPHDLRLPAGTWLESGRLRVEVALHDTSAGAALGEVARDVVFEASVRLDAGDDDDGYGLFVRRAASGRYVCCTITPGGVLAVRHFDGGTFQDVARAELAPGMVFAPGLGADNLFSVVACGPQLTFLLNRRVLLGVTVQRGLAEGGLGVLVQHGATSPAAVASVAWAQVRDALPPARVVLPGDERALPEGATQPAPR